MKRFFALALAATLICTAALSMQSFMGNDKDMKKDKEGHVLTGLWQEYDAATNADRPKTAAKTLESIRKKAKADRLSWDFYDASRRAFDLEVSRNWKVRDSMKTSLDNEFDAYDEPVVSFTHKGLQGKNAVSFVKENSERLKSTRNEGFYHLVGVDYYLQEVFPELIRNDYEYALWKGVARTYSAFSTKAPDWAAEGLKLLSDEVAGRYPESQYLDFLPVNAEPDRIVRKKRLEEYAEANKGKAVRLMALSEIALYELDSLNSGKATSEEYKAFYDKCMAWEKERKSYSSGMDGKIAGKFTIFSDLAAMMKGPELFVGFKGDSLAVRFRNLASAEVTITSSKDGDIVFKQKVTNPARSFYKQDEVRVALPLIDDGDYKVTAVSGKQKYQTEYSRKSLSIAMREDSDGMKFYVADAISGEPEETVDLELFLSGKSVAKASGVTVDGFTPIPENISGAVRKSATCFLVASSRGDRGNLRKTNEIQYGTSWRTRYSNASERDTTGKLFTDKAAYNPGETVKFKAIFYERNLSGLKVLPAGEKVVAQLFDTEDNEVSRLDLTTNCFGSVAGEFKIPEGLRNGTYELDVYCGDTNIFGLIKVDEFILPSYELTFDESDRMYLPGDTVTVSGKIASYSGHSLSAAKVEYSVSTDGKTVKEGTLTLDEEGSFSITFPSSGESGFFDVKVKVTDGTGETREFSNGVPIIGALYLDIVMETDSKGSVLGDHDRNTGRLIIFSGEDKSLKINCNSYYGNDSIIPVPVSYELTGPSGVTVFKGSAISGEEFNLTFKESGEYILKTSVDLVCPTGEVLHSELTAKLLRLDDNATTMDARYETVFKCIGPSAGDKLKEGEGICLQVGAGKGDCWILAELFGDHRNLLERRMVHLSGEAGMPGSLEKLEFTPGASWSGGVYLQMFYFRDGESRTFSKTFKIEKQDLELPLQFSRFTDKALPDARCTITLDGSPDAEAVVSVFDKSSEAFARNRWNTVYRPSKEVETVYISGMCGGPSSFDENGIFATKGGPLRMSARNAAVMMDSAPVEEAVSMTFEVPSPGSVTGSVASVSEGETPVAVRSDFSTSLAFEPFLRPDKDGKFSFEFQTSDKLSTFVVQVYAHDKEMHDALLRREMVVTMPVKVNVVEPKYLYKGDSYVLHATVSSESDEEISGTVSLNLYPSADREGSKAYSKASRNVVIPAKGSVPVEFEIDTKDHDEVGILVSFTESGKKYSDAVFVSVPVFEAAQTITEAHSAVLLSGKDKNALLKKLQKEFTGTTHKGAEYSERDIRQMVLDAIPSKFEPKGKDVISLTETFYVRKVAESLGATVSAEMSDEKLLSQITACRNADGGYGWFQGMKSSPSITAVILERLASLRSLGIKSADFGTEAAVKFLDNCQFTYDEEIPYWRGYLSTEQYLHVRSLYSDVPFSLAKGVADKKSFKEFKKHVAGYLVPSASDGRGMQGQILAKARRLSTLDNLLEAPSGKDLAAAWGIKFDTSGKLKKSFEADVVSLIEYAVGHPDGGWYYPNAVMPWRGLLESELYAHTILCRLMSGELSKGVSAGASFPAPEEIANGVRLWMMLQKETQNWDSDPAYVDAVGAILAGGENVLETKVITLTKTYRKPFREIVAAGNGFTIERKFFKEVSEDGSKKTKVAVEPGTVLNVGDKVIAEYQIWSQENRSFVKLTVPREAAFRPVQQISGNYGWWLSPVGGRYSIVPQGYRNVKSDVTEYYFDVYPEEKTSISEEFYVTQEGVFSAPAVTIESIYAPHYRANGAHSEPVVSKTVR